MVDRKRGEKKEEMKKADAVLITHFKAHNFTPLSKRCVIVNHTETQRKETIQAFRIKTHHVTIRKKSKKERCLNMINIYVLGLFGPI